jgi:hypothetical protein
MRRLIQSAKRSVVESVFSDVHLKAHAKEMGGGKGGRGNFVGRCGIASRASEEQDTSKTRVTVLCQHGLDPLDDSPRDGKPIAKVTALTQRIQAFHGLSTGIPTASARTGPHDCGQRGAR